MKILETHWGRGIKLVARYVNHDREVRIESDHAIYQGKVYVRIAISPWWTDFLSWRRRCRRTKKEVERMVEVMMPGNSAVVDIYRGYEIPENAPRPTA